MLGERIAKALDLTRRSIGPTGSIDLTETQSLNQKDRLAAFSPVSDEQGLSGSLGLFSGNAAIDSVEGRMTQRRWHFSSDERCNSV